MAVQFTDQLDAEKHDLETALQKKILRELLSIYPGYPWVVYASYDQGMAAISLTALIKEDWGFRLHIEKLEQLSAEGFTKRIRQAGGQILEAAKLQRGNMDETALLATITDSSNVDRGAIPEAALPLTVKDTEKAIEIAAAIAEHVLRESTDER